MRKFYAQDIMSSDVVCLDSVASVQTVIQCLEETNHNGFPLIDEEKRYVGIVLRSQLITLLQKRDFIDDPNAAQSFYQLATRADFERNYPRCPTISDISVEIEHLSMFIDLRPYMNPVPFTVRESSPLTRVFLLFRTMGIRHLTVVDIDNKVVGMVTRKNLVHLEERGAQINQNSAAYDEYAYQLAIND